MLGCGGITVRAGAEEWKQEGGEALPKHSYCDG